jgi:hypothetical protein
MNPRTAVKIMHLVEGMELEDGLATIGIALIHLCNFHDIEKDHMLDAMSGQWDLYQRQMKKQEARDQHKAKMN